MQRTHRQGSVGCSVNRRWTDWAQQACNHSFQRQSHVKPPRSRYIGCSSLCCLCAYDYCLSPSHFERGSTCKTANAVLLQTIIDRVQTLAGLGLMIEVSDLPLVPTEKLLVQLDRGASDGQTSVVQQPLFVSPDRVPPRASTKLECISFSVVQSNGSDLLTERARPSVPRAAVHQAMFQAGNRASNG